jgi:hypothetical protein
MTSEIIIQEDLIRNNRVRIACIIKGETMTVMDYRTRDQLVDYGFSIEFQSDVGWRVYIVFQPFYQDHDDSLQIPYQSIEPDGRRYVNWPPKIDSLGEARTVAALWAELIHQYHRTQKQRRAAPAGPDRLDDTVDAGGAGPKYQDRGPVTPYPALEAA